MLTITPNTLGLTVQWNGITIGSIRRIYKGEEGEWLHYHRLSDKGFKTPAECAKDLRDMVAASGSIKMDEAA